MPGDRVERLRASLEEFFRTGQIPADYFAPDFELHQSSSIVDTAGVFRGPGASQASLDELGVRMVVYEEPGDALDAVGLPRADASLP